MNSSLAQISTHSPLDRSRLPRGPIHGLYVHVPFCFHKCHYCDFYSITRQDAGRMGNYVDLILREAELWQAWSPEPRTVFFGGGTPSLLPPDEMRRLVLGLGSRIDLTCVNEWTIEANPATLSDDYCSMLRSLGADRLSMGAQSFQPSDLELLERHHAPADVFQSIEMARRSGFERINVDLIYAIPGQTSVSWADSLDKAISLGTEHVSAYALTYEPNTPLAVRKRLGRIQPSPDELELEMMRQTRRRLSEAGLEAYEISNYARAGEACRHNLNYWTGGSYLGLGPSAASHIHGSRWRNAPHLGAWEKAVEGGQLPTVDVEHLTPLSRACELAMLMLRLTEGIHPEVFQQKTGHDPATLFAPALDRLSRAGLVSVSDDSIRLTESALHLADGVAAEFLALSEHLRG